MMNTQTRAILPGMVAAIDTARRRHGDAPAVLARAIIDAYLDGIDAVELTDHIADSVGGSKRDRATARRAAGAALLVFRTHPIGEPDDSVLEVVDLDALLAELGPADPDPAPDTDEDR